MAISSGRDQFLGYPINLENRKCLFISLEESSRARYKRLSDQITSFSPEEKINIGINYLLSTEEFPNYLWEDSDWKLLKTIIERDAPGIVVIDSLSRISGPENNAEKLASEIMINLKEISNLNNTAITIVNHTPKDAYGNEITAKCMSGSRIFLQEADFLYGINMSNKRRYFKKIFSRYEDDFSDDVDEFMIDNNRNIVQGKKVDEYQLLKANDGRSNRTNDTIVLHAIKLVLEGSSELLFNSKDIDYLCKPEGDMSRGTFYNVINRLQENNTIVREGNGNYSLLVGVDVLP